MLVPPYETLSREEKHKFLVTESRTCEYLHLNLCSSSHSFNKKCKMGLFGNENSSPFRERKEQRQIFCISRKFANHCFTKEKAVGYFQICECQLLENQLLAQP